MVKAEDDFFPQTRSSLPSTSRSRMIVDYKSKDIVNFGHAVKLENVVELDQPPNPEHAVKFENDVNSSNTTSLDHTLKLKTHVKLDSPSQSPTVDVPQKSNISPTPTPPPQSTCDGLSTNGTASKASTPPPKQSRKLPMAALQFIGDLPIARQEGLASFTEIPENNYQYKTLGRSRELLESMTCDCTYEHGIDSEDMACGPYSDCINRLTQVECLPGDCRCRSYCQNQRFQRKQYANIEIVLTEKKGYGLRAEEDLPKDTFIYEYVGDVVNPVSFKKRMRDYAQEGIQHFYFMMLQKDEFIDATKNGGIGRFANHSCNPNCYVAKWTIGDRVQMGIFAKRLIRKYEELTFNYNVDRYGHQAQTCFCGEPNCVGFIGGKTQTDIAAIDDLYLDALGITDENELMELKGTKKKKGKKIDDPDFMPTMKPVIERDIPKVVQAIRQTTSRKMLYKILTRIRITEDQAALRQLMRLRGYSIMTNVLSDYREDVDIILLALECMETWPLMNKNKVEDSQVYLAVEKITNLEDEKLTSLAHKLLDHWNTLPTYSRIPKRLITAVESGVDFTQSVQNDDDQDAFSRREQEIKRARMEEEQRAIQRLHQRVKVAQEKQRMVHDENASKPKHTELVEELKERFWHNLQEQQKIQAIITSVAEAKAAEEAAAEAEKAEKAAKELAAAKKKEKEKERKQKKPTPEEKAMKEVNKEKRLLKLVGAVVVKSLSKYAKGLGKEDFKKYAKELTQLIAEKEKKSASYKENRLEVLSEDKVVKIKKFCRDYIAKLLRKLDKPRGIHKPGFGMGGHHDTSSTSAATPSSSHDDAERGRMEMSVEEAMDMDGDDNEHGDGGMHNNDCDIHGLPGTMSSPPSIAPTPSSPKSRANNAWGQEKGRDPDWSCDNGPGLSKFTITTPDWN